MVCLKKRHAKYLVRLDDACPTYNKENWDRLEKLLDEYNIKPIVAVIPENRDEKLKYDNPDKGFWDKVYAWQEKHWTIGLHGFEHRYTTKSGGLVPLNKKSEFAGVSLAKQEVKIKKDDDEPEV